MKVDVAVIGSGPGGYVAAIRAAQLGMSVACIEQMAQFGGTCLNIGCIPSKALLETTASYAYIKAHGPVLGIEFPSLAIHFPTMMKRKEAVVKGITDGVAYLFEKNKIQAIKGRGKVTGPHQIEVNGETLEAGHIILATGSLPIELPFLPFDEKKIFSSTGLLAIDRIPKKLLVIGAGVIGVELGSVFSRLGTEVVFVEMLDHICGNLDSTLHGRFLSLLTKQGMQFHLSSKVARGKIEGENVLLEVESGGQKLNLDADAVLVSIGRRPVSQGLGLEEVGVNLSKGGYVVVDGAFKTSVPSILAIGDLIQGPMLAHRASEEGILAAELIAGRTGSIDYTAIPSIIYTHPEVASVGFSEEEAKEMGLTPFTGICPLKSNPRAKCQDDPEGIVKVIGDSASGKLLGLHIMASHASEMIGEGVIALTSRMTVEELANATHAHPTLSEAIKEASLAALKRAINL